MNARLIALIMAMAAIAIAADFAAVEHPEAIVWGAGVRGYWALFGIAVAGMLALVGPILARPIRRPGDYYRTDEQTESGEEREDHDRSDDGDA